MSTLEPFMGKLENVFLHSDLILMTLAGQSQVEIMGLNMRKPQERLNGAEVRW